MEPRETRHGESAHSETLRRVRQDGAGWQVHRWTWTHATVRRGTCYGAVCGRFEHAYLIDSPLDYGSRGVLSDPVLDARMLADVVPIGLHVRGSVLCGGRNIGRIVRKGVEGLIRIGLRFENQRIPNIREAINIFGSVQ